MKDITSQPGSYRSVGLGLRWDSQLCLVEGQPAPAWSPEAWPVSLWIHGTYMQGYRSTSLGHHSHGTRVAMLGTHIRKHVSLVTMHILTVPSAPST